MSNGHSGGSKACVSEPFKPQPVEHNTGYAPQDSSEWVVKPDSAGGSGKPPKLQVKPLSAPAETHKRSEKVTTVTIEFEHLPHSTGGLRLKFTRKYYSHYNRELVFCQSDGIDSFSTRHPDDKFDWEIGMRVSLRYGTIKDRPDIYRAFRRWMWLNKAAHECSEHYIAGGCYQCWDCYPWYARVCLASGWQRINTPAMIIAREFGRVKVRVT